MAKDKFIVVETVKDISLTLFHGPFKTFDSAYDWKAKQDKFAVKNGFRWTYQVRAIEAPSKVSKKTV